MDISHAVAQKIRQDRELLDLLKNTEHKAQINRSVLLTLKKPEVPRGDASEEERVAFSARMSELASQAEHGLAGIEGVKVYNLMKDIGHASIGGTAEAVVRAIELDCVKDGILGDTPAIRGPSVS